MELCPASDPRHRSSRDSSGNRNARSLGKVFKFELTLQDIPGSSQLYNESGLLVSFLLDGSADDAELQSKLEAFRTALASGKKDEVRKASRALEKALAKRSKVVRAHAGL